MGSTVLLLEVRGDKGGTRGELGSIYQGDLGARLRAFQRNSHECLMDF